MQWSRGRGLLDQVTKNTPECNCHVGNMQHGFRMLVVMESCCLPKQPVKHRERCPKGTPKVVALARFGAGWEETVECSGALVPSEVHNDPVIVNLTIGNVR